MLEETVSYSCDGVSLKGFLVAPEGLTPRPAIIVAHAWRGLDLFAKNKARALAQLGYVAFCADLYGEGREAKDNEEAERLMAPLFADRALLQKRIGAACHLLQDKPYVDAAKIGGIGFCFGGLAVVELFRSGAPIRGAVSFHGALGTTLGPLVAKEAPIAPSIGGSLLMLHGFNDPLVKGEELLALQQELTRVKADWQLHVYGNASHAFTNPDANDPSMGLLYNLKADLRSWVAMCQFFKEIFS